MGWDIDRFPEGEVNLDLICCICTCILEDPVESPCRHVFCSQCIKTWLSNQKSCPHCRAPVHKRDLQSVVPLLKNIISKQKIFCDNKNRGCPEAIALESLQGHIASCAYGLVACTYEGCHIRVLRKDHKAHVEVCAKRTVMCENGCEMFLTLGEQTSHNCVQSLRSHFQDVTNELLGRIAKLEEVVNDLASKSNNSSSNISHRNIRNNHNTHHHAHRHQGGGDIDDDSVHCVSYNIPSPHRSYNSSSSVSPPIRYTALNDIDNTINLDNYNPGNTTNNTNDDVQNEYSDSVESIESDDSPANLDDDHHNDGGYVGNNRRSPMRRRNESVTYDPPMSPVYGSSVVHTGPTRGRREAPARHNPGGRQEHRSRSPTSTGTRQTVNRRSTNATTTTTTLSSGRNNRRHHHQHSFDDDDYEGGRGEQPSAMVDDGLVLRIGVSRTVSDSSASASSTDSDTE